MTNLYVHPAARDICSRLRHVGHSAYVVGGCVRDALMMRTPHDWDIATSARPEVVQALFDRTIPTGIKYGTITVLMHDEPFEVTTYRTDGTYTDSRRPDEVRYSDSIAEDLARRDFTMNAIAYDPIDGQLVDPHNGRGHILFREIHCVGRPVDRLMEDPLRIMRALRFSATLGFSVGASTLEAIRLLGSHLTSISGERTRIELLKLLGAKRPSIVLGEMARMGVLFQIIPELLLSMDHPQNVHHRYDVLRHTFVTVDAIEGSPMRRMGALLHDVGKPASAARKPGSDWENTFYDHDKIGADMARDVCNRLKFSNEDKDRVVGMVEHHMFGYDATTTDKALRRFIRKAGVNLVPDLVALRVADYIGKGFDIDPEERLPRIRERIWGVMGEIASGKAAVHTKQLAITGRDVMAELGIEPGPKVGVMLAALLDAVTDDPALNERGVLLKMLPSIQC